MAPTETLTELDPRTVIKDFVEELIQAVSDNKVQDISAKILCTSPGTETFDGYQFHFRNILVVIDGTGGRISMKQGYLDRLELLEFVDLTQVQELFRACGDALRRRNEERLGRRQAQVAAQRRAHEDALARLAKKIKR
jgi:hypothetical protein